MLIDNRTLAAAKTAKGKKPSLWDVDPEITSHPSLWKDAKSIVPFLRGRGDPFDYVKRRPIARLNGEASGLPAGYVASARGLGMNANEVGSFTGQGVPRETQGLDYGTADKVAIAAASDFTMVFVGKINALPSVFSGIWKHEESIETRIRFNNGPRGWITWQNINLIQETVDSFTLGEDVVLSWVVRVSGQSEFWVNGSISSTGAARSASAFTIRYIGHQYAEAYGIEADYEFLGIWNRALDASELEHIARDPFTMVRPDLGKLVPAAFVPGGGNPTATGALVSGAATIAGEAEITQLATGALVSGAAVIDGAASIPAGVAPVVETTTVGLASGASTSVATAKPAGTASNELVIFPHGADGGSTPTTLSPPTGAVEIIQEPSSNNGVVSAVYRLGTGGAEPANYTAFSSGSEKQVLIALRVTGTDPADAIDGFAFATSFTGNPVCPDLTTVASDCRILRIMAQDFASGTLVEDSGYPVGTEGYYLRASNNPGGGGATILGAASEVQSTPGPVGTAEWTPTGNFNDDWVAFTIALKPGVSAGPAASGSLISGSAEVSGSAEITQLATGALVSGAATITGEASIPVPLEAEGALVSGSAVIDGTAITHRLASGDLISGSAVIDGSAVLAVVAQGALASGSAQISGTAFIPSYATGALVSGSAIINGISVSGDGWSPVNPGGSEVWSPVSSGGSEDWQDVPKGGNEKWL